MEINELVYFLKAAEYEHYTRAAEELYITQPALSMAIGRLEKELGVKLFEKSGYGVSLTREGRHFIVYAKKILKEFNSIKDEVRYMAEGMSGSVAMGTVLPLKSLKWLQKIMNKFAEERPDVSIRVTAEEQEILLKRVEEGLVDYAVISSAVSGDQYNITELYAEKIGIIMSRENPLAKKKILSIDDLRGERFFCNNSDMDIRSLLTGLNGFEPDIIFEGASPEYIIGNVEDNNGISIMSENLFYEEEGHGGDEYKNRVVMRLLDAPEFTRHIALIEYKTHKTLPAAEYFRELIYREFAVWGE